jgi:hypothetical protein
LSPSSTACFVSAHSGISRVAVENANGIRRDAVTAAKPRKFFQ